MNPAKIIMDKKKGFPVTHGDDASSRLIVQLALHGATVRLNHIDSAALAGAVCRGLGVRVPAHYDDVLVGVPVCLEERGRRLLRWTTEMFAEQ